MITALLTGIVLAGGPNVAVRVDGNGYMRFVRDGRIVYATSANLTVRQGLLGSEGLPLTPSVRVPESAIRISVDLGGNITWFSGTTKTSCGRIVLATFDAKPVESQGFYVSKTQATIGNPGEGLLGVIRSAQTSGAQPSVSKIEIQATTEVDTPEVTLGQIATIDALDDVKQRLQDLVVAPTPPVGIDLAVTSTRIIALAKHAGIDVSVDAPAHAVVRAKSQTVSQDDFVAVAVKAVQEKVGAEVPLASSISQDDFRAPLGKLELKPEDVSTSDLSFTVTVACYVDGRRLNSRTIVLQPDASAKVNPGQVVKIVMQTSGVAVELPGKARTAGMLGQTITVVTDSGAVLSGIVIGGGKVQVQLQ